MCKALSRNSAGQRRQTCEQWQKSGWVIELRISEVGSVVMEENAQLSRQLEKTKIEAGKHEERSSVKLNLDKAIDENSSLHAENF